MPEAQEIILQQLLDAFPSIDLENMDRVRLMDRKDTKYMFRQEMLTEVLYPLNHDYHVLWVKGCNCCQYESIYYDTPDMRLYYDHHRGKLRRFKVRHRMYTGSGSRFFEIKFKTHNDRTVKERVKVKEAAEGIGIAEAAFLEDKTGLTAPSLEPVIRITFTRTTLVNLQSPERVTLDSGLVFEYQGKKCALPGIVIAEAKQERTGHSAFVKRMKEMHLRPGSLSKYCLGVSLLVPGIRKNNFKPKIKQLNTLIHGHSAGSY